MIGNKIAMLSKVSVVVQGCHLSSLEKELKSSTGRYFISFWYWFLPESSPYISNWMLFGYIHIVWPPIYYSYPSCDSKIDRVKPLEYVWEINKKVKIAGPVLKARPDGDFFSIQTLDFSWSSAHFLFYRFKKVRVASTRIDFLRDFQSDFLCSYPCLIRK